MSKNGLKKKVIIIVCSLSVGLLVGSVATWLIAKNYYEKQKSAVEQSLEDGFWNNGSITGDNTAAQTQPNTAQQAEAQTATDTVTTERQTAPYGGHKFILNTSSKKIHTPDCSAVKTIDPENYRETDDFLDALAKGYTQCKQCYPID